jgi:hypothetical protein
MLRVGSTWQLTCLLAWIILAAAACGPSTVPATGSAGASGLPSLPTTSGAPSSSPGVAASLRDDLDAMLEARDTIHPDGWHGMARTAWLAEADAAVSRAAGSSDDERLVELLRLAAMPAWAGRDGHSGIFPFGGDSGTHLLPLRWWRFTDGLVITAARPPHEDLVGARVEAIEGRPIDEVLALVEPLVPRDNPSNLLAYSTIYLRVAELLAGLGVLDSVGPATFTVTDRDGMRRDVVIDPVPAETDDAWQPGAPHRLPPTDAPWLRDQDAVLWWEYLAESRTLFVQFNAVRTPPSGVVNEIVERAKAEDVDRVVVDIRHNGGGDNTTLHAFEQALRDPAIDQPGRLFVLIGRLTFSAAANFATDLETTTSAVFAGEAMGGSPNLYGDVRRVPLPASGLSLFMAARYWERSTPDDPRITIEPTIVAELSSADYFAGRDPVLAAILEASAEAE